MKREDLFQPGEYASIPKAILALPSKKLSPAGKLVWAAVVERFGVNEEAWPGAGTIAKQTGLTRKGAQLAIAQLERLKLLTIFPPVPGRSSNTYRITEYASVQSSLANAVPTGSEQSTLPSEQSTLVGSVQSSHELPNTTTQLTTQSTTQDSAASPPAACGGSPLEAVGVKAGDVEAQTSTARKMTKVKPEDVQDVKSMTEYLLSGHLNWERYRKSETDYGVSQWGAQQFMGFYWWQVSLFRAKRNIPLTLPPWNKLAGHFRNLLTQMTNERLFNLINFVIYYFDLIRCMLGKAGNTVFLDESSFVNPLVNQTANQLMNMTVEQRKVLIHQYGLN